MELFFPPQASRDGAKAKKRILLDTQKKIEKHKQEEQIEQSKQLDKVTPSDSTEFEGPAFETRSLYYGDVRGDEDADEDSDSYYSRQSTYFRNAFLYKCCKKIITSNRGLRLSWSRVLFFTFFLQVPLTFLVHHVSIVEQWGGMMVLIIYSVIGFAICVPVYMMYLFVGFFTRRSYIRYWDCVPILKGVAFSLAGIFMYQELFNVLFAAIALNYIILMFSKQLPWHNCEFERASNSCVSIASDTYTKFTKHCCVRTEVDRRCNYSEQVKQSFKYATFDYYNRHILNLDEEGMPILTATRWTLIAILAFLWFLIYILVLLGLKKISKMMTAINLTMIVILVLVTIAVFIVSPGYSTIYEFSTNFTASATDYTFWLYTALNIIHRELPCDAIAYGAISKEGVSVTVDTTIIYILKFFFTAVFTVFMSVAVKFQQDSYNVMYSECIMTDGDVLFFALFPDIISRMPIPQIWLIIYFLMITFWGLSTAVYVYIAFYEALIEEFTVLEKWRLITVLMICTGAALYTIFDLSPDMMKRLKLETLEILPQTKLFMLCISFIGLYFYSITTFRNDYHFYSGEILGSYWIIGLKVSILTILISAVLNWLNLLDDKTGNYPLIISSVPVIVGIVLMTTRYAIKVSKTLISPSPRWGPPGRNQKLARIKFDPLHDLHYRSVKQKCSHSCLLYSNNLKKEMKHWHTKKIISEGKGETDDTLALPSTHRIRSKGSQITTEL